MRKSVYVIVLDMGYEHKNLYSNTKPISWEAHQFAGESYRNLLLLDAAAADVILLIFIHLHFIPNHYWR